MQYVWPVWHQPTCFPFNQKLRRVFWVIIIHKMNTMANTGLSFSLQKRNLNHFKDHSLNRHVAEILWRNQLFSHGFIKYIKLFFSLFYLKVATCYLQKAYFDQNHRNPSHTLCDPKTSGSFLLCPHLAVWHRKKCSHSLHDPIQKRANRAHNHSTLCCCSSAWRRTCQLCFRGPGDTVGQFIGFVHCLFKQGISRKLSTYYGWKYSDIYSSRIRSF